MKKVLKIVVKLLLYVLAVPVVLVLRLIRPWLLVRWDFLISTRIGHFTANTELYLCRLDAGINEPQQRYVDLFYMGGPICNQQLAIMWRRILHVWPAWIMLPIVRINRLIPGGAVHEIGENTKNARDVQNLLDQSVPHLEFTADEEARGKEGLRAMGIPQSSRFVCLIVRDSAYLNDYIPLGDWAYHGYRDSDIQNYMLAAEELARRGYFVIRMGAKVKEAIKTEHPRVIDYATNGMRTDFMDIYLGAKCEFCLSTGLGYDGVPEIFRRPLAIVNDHSLEYIRSWNVRDLTIVKKYWLRKEHRFMTFREILDSGVGRFLMTRQFEESGIELIENSPEEIAALVLEMDDRLKGKWQTTKEDDELQYRFWSIYKSSELHGKIMSRIGAEFLRQHRECLQ
jgi:putative glycosyltransferase (TIGR04372 family)